MPDKNRSIASALERADREVAAMALHYPEHLSRSFDEMSRLANVGNWESVSLAAHDLKGQAGTMGWPVIGRIAQSLESAISTAPPDKLDAAAAVHIDAMKYCLQKSAGPGDPAGKRILESLYSLVSALSGDEKKYI